jgi:hypothetical protein
MNISQLLDSIKLVNGLKSDAALSRALEIAPPVASKMRSGTLGLGSSLIIRIHLLCDIPVAELVAIARTWSPKLAA